MISLVCPVYNEAIVVGQFFSEVSSLFSNLGQEYEIIFVNDGSTDNTLATILQLKENNPDTTIRLIDFSRNFGKEAALSAGLEYAAGEAVIPIDVDLQDPPEVMIQMIEKWKEGYDVVLAKRENRSSDTLSKRATANWFYEFHNKIAHTPIPPNVGDYRLMDRKVVDAINQLPEKQRFMKGLFAWVGFNSTEVCYTRAERSAGETKFNGWRLWNLAIEGITGFSTMPLRIWSYVGLFISFLSFMYLTFIIFFATLHGIDVPGYASLLTVILFIGGIQLIGMGILGEYIGRIYLETKSRPLYIINKEYK